MDYEFLFYWISWMLWVVFFFFLKNDVIRFWLSSAVLVWIITSGLSVNIFQISIRLSLIFLLFVSFILLSFSRNKWTAVLGAFGIGFGYGAYQVFEQINPLWFIFPSTVILLILGYLIVQYISADIYVQLGIWFLGITYGELLFGLVQFSYGIAYFIGDDEYLYHSVVFVAAVLLYRLFKWVSQKVSQFVQAYS
ncbi:MAG: hypothetical protein H0Z32_00650 [Bacillaceae bacterium]|nr:hypothetical protein [Bacillaceae bacterium]